MDTTFVEYDENGELFHICTVSTTEGDVAPPPLDADAKTRAAHKQAVENIIKEKAAATRAELEDHRKNGKRLLVLPDGAPQPEFGRHTVDHAKGTIVRRTDAQFNAWKTAQEAKAQPPTPATPATPRP